MTIALTAFTARGLALAQRLADGLNAQDDTAAVTPCSGPEHLSLADFTANAFAQADALVFVGAAGIAVRAIAPHLSSKTRDPAVVVLDETGAFAVSLLSGHLGGANALTLRLAGLCGAQPVITTATDRSGLWAADDWARKNGCAVAEPERIKQVSGALLAGGSLALFSEFSIGGVWPRGLHPAACAAKAQVVLSLNDTDPDGARPLHLVPRIAVLGVGCRKGTPAGQILELLSDFLARVQVSRRALCRALSTYPAQALAALPGPFTPSAFVQSVTGVDNVCERAAVLGSGGTLLAPKYAKNGVTLALALRPFAPEL